MRLLLELWGLMSRHQRRALVGMEVLALAMAISTLAGVAAVIPFFSALGDPGLIARNAWLHWLYQRLGLTTEASFLMALGAALVGATLLANAINLAGSLVVNRLAYRIGNQFFSALFEEYLHRGHAFHVAADSATLFSNVVWEVSRGTTGLLQSLILLTTSLATTLLIVGCIAIVHPVIGLAAVAVVGTSYALVYLMTRQRLLRNGQIVSEHTQERTRIAFEAFGAMKEIMVQDAQGFFHQRFAQSCAAISRAAASSSAIAQSPRNVLDFMVVGGLVAGAILSIGRGTAASEWLAQLSFLGFAAYRLLPALQQIFHGLVQIRTDRAAFSRIAGDLRRARAPRPRRGSDAARWQGRPQHAIEMKGVCFRYTPDLPLAIRDVHLKAPAHSTIGIVGPSGSGKTTLAELLLGLLPASAGTIEIDGIELTTANSADWQSTVAYVPQQAYLFASSLAENIALATNFEQIDLARLERALRLAQLDDLVRALPSGYRERIGDGGIRLSGGQRQRVGIARALYRNASLLVLDEPTSALDGLTENEIMATVEALSEQCTIILIAHLASTVRRCDLIFQVEAGAVVASGTYAELMSCSDRFRGLLLGGLAEPPHGSPGSMPSWASTSSGDAPEEASRFPR
jgi:ABC-type multidrug transport system fused ATPase/permease subunit